MNSHHAPPSVGTASAAAQSQSWRDGAIECVARPAHMGRTTQVWDAVVTNAANGKTIAIFRCTQMILYPKSAS